MKTDRTVYHPVGRVVIRRIGEDNLLVPISGGSACENVVFPVNDTGLFLWERLAAGKTMDEAARELSEHFDVGLDQGRADCEGLLGRLVAENLLEAVSG